THMTIVGPKKDPRAETLHALARALPARYKRLEWLDSREGKLPNPDVEYPDLDQPAAFACSAAGKCMATNACKGQSACKSASNACKGLNACKGNGFSMASQKECAAKGGVFVKS
ncbi:MAG: hypothetical protein Q8N40_24980, partial [Bradyrhizobium sp.]|nr:hypothetical protein [Bradyrhizobium sp.]